MSPNEPGEARKLRHLMQSDLDDIADATATRLEQSRRIAISRKKPEARARTALALALTPQAAGAGSWTIRARRLGTVLPLLVGLGLFAGLYYAEDQQRIHDAADIDMAVLIDELPLSAYLDDGFRAFVANGGE